MARHRHEFVEQYEGMMAFGLSREEDERYFIAFMQKFSDDDLMKLLCSRMSGAEMEKLLDRLMAILRRHLSEKEYHRYFLKE